MKKDTGIWGGNPDRAMISVVGVQELLSKPDIHSIATGIGTINVPHADKYATIQAQEGLHR